MLKDITLGQYFPGNSLVHRLDPRLKIVLIAALIVVLFLTNTAVAYCLLAAFILFAIWLSKLSLRMILRGLKPIMVIIVLTGVLNLFYTPGTEILRVLGVLSITRGRRTDCHYHGCASDFIDCGHVDFDLYHLADFSDRCAGTIVFAAQGHPCSGA